MEKRPISALCLSSLRRTWTRTRLPPGPTASPSNLRPRPGLLLSFLLMEASRRRHVKTMERERESGGGRGGEVERWN